MQDDEPTQVKPPTLEPSRVEVSLQRALSGVARALATQLSVEGACSVVLSAVERVFGATSARIMLEIPRVRRSALRCFAAPAATRTRT
jgi:hypothetical protein